MGDGDCRGAALRHAHFSQLVKEHRQKDRVRYAVEAVCRAMLLAFNPWQLSMQVRGELHGVEVTPSTAFTIVVLGAHGFALGQTPEVSGVLDLNINPAAGHIEIN